MTHPVQQTDSDKSRDTPKDLPPLPPGGTPVAWQYRRDQSYLDAHPGASEWVYAIFPTEREAQEGSYGGFEGRPLKVVRPLYAAPPPPSVDGGDQGVSSYSGPPNRHSGSLITKGPWVSIISGIKGEQHLVIEDKPGHLRPICVMEDGHPKAEANATAIAALPDLIEALRGLLRATDFDQDEPWVVAANSALAKARGGQ